MRKQIHKKANTMPFHWVFVLLAGAAIIVLFTMFINTTKVSSERSLGGKVLVHFDTIFSSLATRDGVESNITSHPDIILEFSCDKVDNSVSSNFRMRGGVSKDLNQIALFSQKRVYGDTLFTSISLYDIPFAVGTMVYVTDPNTLYILSSYNPLAPELQLVRRLLPTGATVLTLGTTEYETLANVDFRGYHDVVIIEVLANSVQEQGRFISGLPANTGVYLYRISDPISSNILDGGIVTGFSLRRVSRTTTIFEQQGQITYNNVDELKGIIHSNDIDYASCVLQKAQNNIPRTSFILMTRSELLRDETTNGRCKILYQGAIDRFNDIILNPTQYRSATAELEYINRNLDIENCPVLY
jgi:hypothetical protein